MEIKKVGEIQYIEVDEAVVKRNRTRVFVDDEIVALSCKNCGGIFLLENFYNNKRGVVGKHNICIKCDNKKVDKHQKQNPEMALAKYHNYRARKNGNRGELTGDSVSMMFERAKKLVDGKEALVCQVSGEVLDFPVLGHIIAVNKRGGHSAPSNMIVISQKVNTLQGDENLWRFLLTEKGLEIANKETVKETLEMIADSKNMSPKEYLMTQLEFKEIVAFSEHYLGGIKIIRLD